MIPRVVIVGGGFGGLYAARALHAGPVNVTLIDRRNYHLFRPMLYQVATGLLSEFISSLDSQIGCLSCSNGDLLSLPNVAKYVYLLWNGLPRRTQLTRQHEIYKPPARSRDMSFDRIVLVRSFLPGWKNG